MSEDVEPELLIDSPNSDAAGRHLNDADELLRLYDAELGLSEADRLMLLHDLGILIARAEDGLIEHPVGTRRAAELGVDTDRSIALLAEKTPRTAVDKQLYLGGRREIVKLVARFINHEDEAGQANG